MTSSTAIADAIASARADLDEIRDHIADLTADRQSVAAEPCDRDEAESRVAGFVQGAAARGRDLLDRPELFAGDARPISPYMVQAVARDPLAVLAAVAPDKLAEALLANHPGGGRSPDARIAKLAEIDRALNAAEIAEEVATREIDRATGTMLPRRLDADPAVLLAPDHELQPDNEPVPAETVAMNRSTKR